MDGVSRNRRRGVWIGALALAAATAACEQETELVAVSSGDPNFPTVQLPRGFRIEKVVDGLNYPTSIAWDNQNRMYVLEAGGQFTEEPPPARLLRIDGGQATEVVNLDSRGIRASAVGMTFHNGAFFVTHRDADRTGAVSRVGLDGSVTRILTGIIDSQSEHQVNDIKVGPDGRMYLASGPAGNSAVLGIDNMPLIARSPGMRTTPCQDIILTGRNYETPDFRTPDPSDVTRTGAFVPFGTATTPGQRIAGTRKCGGAILVFDPNNAEATVRPFVHGLRNVIGFTWNSRGEMFATVNGFDVRGSRPVNDRVEATYRVREGTWYGWPDYSGALEPLNDPKFDLPDRLQVPIFVRDQPQPRKLEFVIDQAASNLRAPDRGLVAGLHEINSSPSLIAAAPASWGDMADNLFVAEWGDLAPGTTPLRGMATGSRITRIRPGSTQAEPFVFNAMPGPASAQGARGMGLERPFDVKFGPDGAMYIVDYGIAVVKPDNVSQNKLPYEFPPRTGAVWRVTRTGR
jgi:glucose/arabinose dehydrogenase